MVNRAYYIADSFIAHFSQPLEEQSFSSEWKVLIEEKDEKKLINSVQVYEKNTTWMDLYNYDLLLSNTAFRYLTKGHRNEVWKCDDLPDRVFKYMKKENAEEQLRAAKQAHTYACTQKPFWGQSPVAQIIEIPNSEYALYVEEKLPLRMSEMEHVPFLDKIFTHLSNPECSPIFKENLFKMVEQICAFIEETGFWDVGLGHNLPEFSYTGTHFCITDFEKINSEKRDMLEGIQRLAQIFCLPPFSDYLFERYNQHLDSYIEKFGVNETKQSLQEGFHKTVEAAKQKLDEHLNIETANSEDLFCPTCFETIPVSLDPDEEIYFCGECGVDLPAEFSKTSVA